MLKFNERVAQNSTSTGAGDLTIDGAIAGYFSFDSRMSVGDTCYYEIQLIDANDFPTVLERGLGTYSATDTLARTRVLNSVNAGSQVSLAAGTKRIAMIKGPPPQTQPKFTDLTDVPQSYVGQAGKLPAVNSAESGLEFVAGGGTAIPDSEIPYGTGTGLTSISTFHFADGYVVNRETALGNGARVEIQGTPTGDPLNKARLAIYADGTPYSALQCSVPNPASTNQEEGLLIEAQLDGSQTIVSITSFNGAVLQLSGIDETGSGVATFTATNAPGAVSPQKWLKFRIGTVDGWIPWFAA